MIDTATVTFQSNTSFVIYLYTITSQCYQCAYNYVGDVKAASDLSLLLDTRWPINLQFLNDQRNLSYQATHQLAESGSYVYNVNETNDGSIKFTHKLISDPPDSRLPFIILCCIFVSLVVLWPLLLYLGRCYRSWRGSDTDYFLEMDEWETKIEYLSERSITSNTRRIGLKSDDIEELVKKPKRFLSLDVYRGLAVVFMIFINSGGGGYYFMGYAVWNGVLVADFIFPSFLFIMGFAIHLSYENMMNKLKRRRDMFCRIILRAINLIIIGLLLNKGANLVTWRIPGVLQKLGICYFLIGTLNTLTIPSDISIKKWDYYKYLSPFKDVLPFWLQWLIVIGFAVAHVTLSFYLPVPGCPTGYLGPGGLADNGKYTNCSGGAAGYIDRLLFGEKHLNQLETIKEMYKTNQVFDSEGLLGYLSSLVLTFLGVQAGRILTSYQSNSSHNVRWFLWAAVMGSIGFGLTLNTRDDGIIPINGKLWSISYVFITAASSFILMIFFHSICDCCNIWRGAPFKFCGVNSLALYIGHQLLPLHFYWREDAISDHTSYLIVSSIPTAFWIIFSIVLYKKKMFLTF